MNSLFRSRFSSNSNSISNNMAVNEEEINIQNFMKKIEKWEIPKVQKDLIYQKSNFKWLRKTSHTIKVQERDVPLKNTHDSMRLLSHESITRQLHLHPF